MFNNQMRRDVQNDMNEEDEESGREQFYKVQKILDMQVREDGGTYCLIKWEGWDSNTSTWERYSNVCHLTSLLEEYHEYRKKDKQNHLKLEQQIHLGDNPYNQTQFHGHFLYGDSIKSIVAIKVYENAYEKNVFGEIEWKQRENGFKPKNSVINTKIIMEHDPQYLVGYYLAHLKIQSKAK